ncbi:F-box protein AFR [Cicer arietinum]|uniref:F-box protein AFR n=1 Tax=Cicer arietinum TaxID=3827 RepID=A0A1S2YAI9_CICAR|nr:F-box protein AFR [Cicer arietinum]
MMIMEEKRYNTEHEELIPQLPNEIAEICLLHVPYPYHCLVRSVSSSWNRAITNPSFLLSKRSFSRPNIFVSAFHTLTAKIQWQSLDPSTGRWFLLPPTPLPNDTLACVSLPRQGKIFLIKETESTLVYNSAINRWLPASDMISENSVFAADEVSGGIVTAEKSGTNIYDSESDTWRRGAKFTGELERYETVVAGGKMYVTEGWSWPFVVRPKGGVYDLESDTWREMRNGMSDGWIGVSVGVCGRVFVIPELDLPLRVYDEVSDTWRGVSGDLFPRDVMKKPLVAKGLDDRIYVVSHGLNVAIGTVVVNNECSTVNVTWQVVEASLSFREFSPSTCQVLYA